MARWIIVFLVILVVLFAYDPGSRAQAAIALAHVKPAVVLGINHFYMAVRPFLAGEDIHDWIDDHPDPPDGDFDRIVTTSLASSF